MSNSTLATLLLLLLIFSVGTVSAGNSHVINFRWPDLFPESLVWDPKSQHFIVGSLRSPTLLSISDAGVTTTLLPVSTSNLLPPNSFVVGLALHPRHHTQLSAVLRHHDHPTSSSLATFRLPSFTLLSLTPLPDDPLFTHPTSANDVTLDYSGNAYVTDSANNVIIKVNPESQESSILSKSNVFKSSEVDPTTPWSFCGLNGVVYIAKGYLLTVQSNTGKLYKVNVDDGSSRRVILNKELTAADGMAIRSDGVLVVVSQFRVYYIKSDDSWSQGVIFDETALDVERHASGVTVGDEGRVYVLYGHVNEGMMGNVSRQEWSIVEVVSEKESKEENVWVFILIGLGFAYFLFWRFQMKQLVHNMNKKTT